MRRLLPLLLLCACRPSQAEVDALSAKLDVVAAQQAQILAQIDAGGGDGSEADGHGHAQLIEQIQAVGDGLEMVHRRIDDLERRVDESADRAKPVAVAPRKIPGRPDPAARYKVEIGDAHIDGRDDALITVVAWVDYQCPFSKKVQATLDQVQSHYGKKVRIVAKHNPLSFHQQAMAAALAVEAAGEQGKFWQMHDRVFEDQRSLDDAKFRKLARKLQLDLDEFDKDRRSQALKDKVKGQQAQAVKLGASGTPAFFVNGRFLSGAQPFENFKELIDAEMGTAEALVAKGVKKKAVYEMLIADALEAP